jgi:hypothetical protein
MPVLSTRPATLNDLQIVGAHGVAGQPGGVWWDGDPSFGFLSADNFVPFLPQADDRHVAVMPSGINFDFLVFDAPVLGTNGGALPLPEWYGVPPAADASELPAWGEASLPGHDSALPGPSMTADAADSFLQAPGLSEQSLAVHGWTSANPVSAGSSPDFALPAHAAASAAPQVGDLQPPGLSEASLAAHGWVSTTPASTGATPGPAADAGGSATGTVDEPLYLGVPHSPDWLV